MHLIGKTIIWFKVIIKNIFGNIITNLSQWSGDFQLGVLNIIKHSLIFPMSWHHWEIKNRVLIYIIQTLILNIKMLSIDIIIADWIYTWHHISLVFVNLREKHATFLLMEIWTVYMVWILITCIVILFTHIIVLVLLYTLLAIENSFYFFLFYLLLNLICYWFWGWFSYNVHWCN